jgi:phosphoribosylaminoimidazole carboxylase (NCAIR synthetase)
MRDEFPIVGLIGRTLSTRFLIPAALDLGVDLRIFDFHDNLDELQEFSQKCDLMTVLDETLSLPLIRTFEFKGVPVRPSSTILEAIRKFSTDNFENMPPHSQRNREISVLVARSPHGQAAVWAPTETIRQNEFNIRTIAPAPNITAQMCAEMQNFALDLAKSKEIVGVLLVNLTLTESTMTPASLRLGPSSIGNWTIEGSRTSQYEQHLRAILDLPLGDPSMSARYCVTGDIIRTKARDMYRPYLHLMARSPDLKVHQYGAYGGRASGHVTALGKDLLELTDSVVHALEYMNGVIDE